MEYEGERAIAEMKMEEAKRKAMQDALEYKLVGEFLDPDWAQPAQTNELHGVGLDQAQGFWINGGKQGGNKDEPLPKPETFDNDLPSLLKDGPTTLPDAGWAEAKLTPAEIEERMKVRENIVSEGVSGLRVSEV